MFISVFKHFLSVQVENRYDVRSTEKVLVFDMFMLILQISIINQTPITKAQIGNSYLLIR